MRYRLLGNTGLRISELCLGTMTFGEEIRWGADREESRKIFEAFLEAGGNFIDTANIYTGGTSERYVGEFAKGRREALVIATKYAMTMSADDPNGGGSHRKSLVRSLEASLERLGLDHVDLLWVHAHDVFTPVEETMRALDDAVRAGKVLYVGISDAPAWIVSQANTLASLKGWTPFAALQIQYGLADRTPERDLLPMAEAFGLSVVPWGVLGGGVLSGKYKSTKELPAGTRYGVDEKWGALYVTERNLRIAEAAGAVAREIGRSTSQVALAWARQQRPAGAIVPIVGAKTAAQIRDNLGCLEFSLEEKHLCALDEASRVDLGFPHDFLLRGRQYVHGKTFPLIDIRR